MGGEGSGAKCHSVFQAAQSLTAAEIDSKNCRSVKKKEKKRTLLLSFIQVSDTPFKKAKVPSFIFGGGCLPS